MPVDGIFVPGYSGGDRHENRKNFEQLLAGIAAETKVKDTGGAFRNSMETLLSSLPPKSKIQTVEDLWQLYHELLTANGEIDPNVVQIKYDLHGRRPVDFIIENKDSFASYASMHSETPPASE